MSLLSRLLSLLLVCSLAATSFTTTANARYFDPATGQFISPDSLDPTLPGVGTNRYAYAGNDPINNSDPNGHIFAPVAVGIAAAIGAFFGGSKPANAPGRDERPQHMSDGRSLANSAAAAATVIGVGALGQGLKAAWEFEKKKDTGSETANTTQRIETSTEANNRITHELYKDELRAQMSKPDVQDPALSKLMDRLYRPNAQIGSGSTAAAVRQEMQTGTPVNGRMHAQKAADLGRALEGWIRDNPTASSGDRAAAANVLRDIRNALGGQ